MVSLLVHKDQTKNITKSLGGGGGGGYYSQQQLDISFLKDPLIGTQKFLQLRDSM